jgi:hypothetical protein
VVVYFFLQLCQLLKIPLEHEEISSDLMGAWLSA